MAILVNYAPTVLPYLDFQPSELETILGMIGERPINSKTILVLNSLEEVEFINDNQIFFNRADNKFYYKASGVAEELNIDISNIKISGKTILEYFNSIDDRIDGIEQDLATIEAELDEKDSVEPLANRVEGAQEIKALKINEETLNIGADIDLTHYRTADEEDEVFGVSLNLVDDTYVLQLKNNNGEVISSVDLPLETMVVSARYDASTKKLILTLKNQETIEISIADLVSGLSTATNIENGSGTNSIQQKESSKGFEYDNPNYTPTYTPEFGAKGKDSAVLNGNSMAKGELSTAEGRSTIAEGIRSHAEGTKTTTIGANAHAEGLQSIAKGDHSHAEGMLTQANGLTSHAEGNRTIASQNQAHAEGLNTTASGYQAHAEGKDTKASANNSHTEGEATIADSFASHAEGISSRAGQSTRGWVGYASSGTIEKTISTTGIVSVVSSTIRTGYSISTSVKEDNKTIVATITPAPTSTDKVLFQIKYAISGVQPGPTPEPVDADDNACTHAEGYATQTYLFGSHAENINTLALGRGTHAEGYNTTAFGEFSHSGGQNSLSVGVGSFAHGYNAVALGNESIAFGVGTEATNDGQFVIGKYNDNKGGIFEIGVGVSDFDRETAIWVDGEGHIHSAHDAETDDELVRKVQLNYYVHMTELSNYVTNSYLAQNYTTNIRNGEGAKSIVSYGGTPHATGNFSSAIGYSNNASGEASTALGYRTKATNRGQLSIGVNNKNASNAIFDVGIGSVDGSESGAKSAFTIFADGHAEVDSVGTTNKSLVNKEYIENNSVIVVNTIFNYQTQMYSLKDYTYDDLHRIAVENSTRKAVYLRVDGRLYTLTDEDDAPDYMEFSALTVLSPSCANQHYVKLYRDYQLPGGGYCEFKDNIFIYTALQRKVANLVKINNAYKIQINGSNQNFISVKNYLENNNVLFILLYGNSKLEGRYLSNGEIHFVGIDRDSTNSYLLRAIMTSDGNITYSRFDLNENVEHIINIDHTANGGTYHCQFSFSAPRTTDFTTTGEVASYLYTKTPNLRVPANGIYTNGSNKYHIVSVIASLNSGTGNKELIFEMYKFGDGAELTIGSYGVPVSDIKM